MCTLNERNVAFDFRKIDALRRERILLAQGGTGVRLSVPKHDGCIHRCVYACGGASSRRVCVYVRGCGSSGLCQRVLTLTQGALLLRCAFLPFLFC